jgi:trans-aconitate 2-methyltransferase
MSFEFDGEKYKKASAHQKEWANKILGELSFAGDETILDLGCGDGVITNRLAGMVPDGEVLGIDASAGMIKTARKGRKFENVAFELKNIDDIEYTSRFDFIFSNATLHWVLDHQKLLNNTFQALKRGGAIRFNFAGDGNCSFFFKVIRQAVAEARFKDYFKDFSWPWYMPTIAAYKEIASKTSFADVEIWGENADRHFSDSEAMIKWIDQPSIVPFLEWLPDPQKRQFRDLVVEQMIKETRQKDGTCFETFRRINVRATKPG